MALIRRADAREITRDAVVLDLGDLSRQAQALRDDAARQARAILDKAHAERRALIASAAEEGRREGRERGLREGRAEGIAKGKDEAARSHAAELGALERAWREALERFAREREEMLEDARQDLARVALDLASRIVRRAVEADPTLVREQVAEIVEIAGRGSIAEVRVHPEDAAAARDAIRGILTEIDSTRGQVRLVEDAALARGSCVAGLTRGGTIDASVQAKLDAVAGSLIASRAGGGGGG